MTTYNDNNAPLNIQQCSRFTGSECNQKSNNIHGVNNDFLLNDINSQIDKHNNYNIAYSQNENILPRQTFINSGNLIHNNVDDKLLKEQVLIYNIVADSVDRDYRKYPNPFEYKVSFNAISSADNSNAKIPNKLINVKFIKLSSAILPRCYSYVLDNITSETGTGDNHICKGKLDDDRFSIVNIKEFQDYGPMRFATNQHTRDGFSMVYLDTQQNKRYYSTTNCIAEKYFQNPLKELTSITVKILDSFGRPLTYDFIDRNANTPNECICNSNTYTDTLKAKCVCKYPRHPLNPVLQNNLVFTVGVLTDTINNSTPYQWSMPDR